jgi:hypothetical protein
MNLEVKDEEYLKIFSDIEDLKKNLYEKTGKEYVTTQKLNPNNRNLIESYLLLKIPKEERKSNLLSKIFNYFLPFQGELDSNKTLAIIKQGYNKDYEMKSYLEIVSKNHPYLDEVCKDTCKENNILLKNRED